MNWVLRACVVLGAASFLLGCGEPGGETGRVKGKVTVAGQPVENIAVTFTPESGRPGTGVTDASGNFTISTFAKGDGAVPGTHKVSFFLGGSGDPPPSDLSEPFTPPAQPFNAKYNNAATSGITADVKSGSNEFTWDLEK